MYFLLSGKILSPNSTQHIYEMQGEQINDD